MKIEEQNPYFLEIQALESLKQIIELINVFKRKLAEHLINKEMEIGIEVSKELKDKCMASLMFNQKVMHKCEYCEREFDDGRKLGGHVSKAHLKELSAKKIRVENEDQQSKKIEAQNEDDIGVKFQSDIFEEMMNQEM